MGRREQPSLEVLRTGVLGVEYLVFCLLIGSLTDSSKSLLGEAKWVGRDDGCLTRRGGVAETREKDLEPGRTHPGSNTDYLESGDHLYFHPRPFTETNPLDG